MHVDQIKMPVTTIMYQSIPRASTPPSPGISIFSKKIVKSPPMWASYTIKCPTVRERKTIKFPSSSACQLCLLYNLGAEWTKSFLVTFSFFFWRVIFAFSTPLTRLTAFWHPCSQSCVLKAHLSFPSCPNKKMYFYNIYYLTHRISSPISLVIFSVSDKEIWDIFHEKQGLANGRWFGF